MQGTAIGNEQVTVTASAEGWTVRGTGRLGNPLNLSTSRFELRYDREWHPISLEIDATLRGQPLLMRTTFLGGSATNDITQGGQQNRKVDAVSADPLVLPNMFFSAYEALALRLRGAVLPIDLRAYVAPQVEIAMRVTGRGSERIRTADRSIAATRYDLTLANPGGLVPAEVWVDEESRLLRFRVPGQGFEVAREDVAAVSSRVEKMVRAGDEEVRVLANGFNLAGTLSKPPSATAAPALGKIQVRKLPAVVLVAGSGPVDRDETVAGISIFAQVANRLADAGFIVIRYDKRGVGQSGGRDESATLKDYAEDVLAVVAHLRKRKDVDQQRIAVVGHSEGGLVGMIASADGKKRIAALVLVATPGTTGAELVLEQQRHLLDRMALPEAERQDRMELQQRIQKAVVSGQGWEAIPAGYRRQADTPWFRSFLAFDPAPVMAKVSQPVMVIQGDRDRQVAARHAQLLADAAGARKKNPGADLLVVEGINHLLVPAPTGEADEYAALQDKDVSPKLLDALVSWLKGTLHVDAAGARR
jgi:pimeloyl-ACP methyl ester carboxylesterase